MSNTQSKTRRLTTAAGLVAVAALAPFAALTPFAACGDGQWGAELTLTLATTDASELALAPGAELSLGGGYRMVVTRACLNVETVVVSPVAPEGGTEGDETCFCHGDPPHCHGDCGTTAAGEVPPVIKSVHRALDLLAGQADVFTSGAAPGAYDQVTLSLSAALPEAKGLPEACAALPGRALLLEGELWTPGATQGAPLSIELLVTDKITEAILAASPAEATAKGGRLGLALRLDAALGAVDWSRVPPDAEGRITVGGLAQSNIIAVGALVTGLTSASSWTLAPQAAP